MASADYSVGTKVTADVSNFEKGMNKAEKSLKGFSDKLANSINRLGKKGLIGSMANVTLAMQGLTKSFNTVIKFAKDVGKAINECTEAYKGQVIAERALDTAIANNPFVSGASSKALKEFASEMQKVTNYGDEQLIPMMTNLISLGRTESETMQIMSVALDMSAGMGISLDTAITQLNATLNGNIGRLGQQNAELKNLTEEELKQGKAIEILGEKFKGLSGATADTSKQLANIKGDFKEALGQFTLPSSDMWNRFWTGFYEKGIVVLEKFNDFFDKQIIGKQIIEILQLNASAVAKARKLSTEDVLSDFGYIKEQLSYLSDSELTILRKTLEGQKERTQSEERILYTVKTILHNKELQADQDKKNAEAEARKARLIAEQAEKERELSDIKEKQEKLEGDWANKLFSIRLDLLEETRDKELDNEKYTQQQKTEIFDFYSKQILAMKLSQLEKEKEEALAQENLTQEAKDSIVLYYENRITQINAEEAEKRKKIKADEAKEVEKVEKKTFNDMVKVAGEYTKKIGETFKKVAQTIKKVFAEIGKIIKGVFSVFKFNPDDALQSLLEFEDSVLTFFYETLPKLPQFFASAIQSVVSLLGTLISSIDWGKVQDIIKAVIDVFVQNMPTIVTQLLDLVINIMQSLLEGFIEFVEGGGWKVLLDALLTIQKRIEKFVTDNIDEIVDTLIDMLPDLINTLIDSVVSASKTITKIIKPLIKLILEIINALLDFMLSDEVLDAGLEVLTALIEAIITELIPRIIENLPRIILSVIKAIIKAIPKLVGAIVEGLVNGFLNTNWIKVVKDCFWGFVNAIKDFFGIHSPSTLFMEFGEYMVEGLWQGIKNLGSWLWDNVKGFFSNLIDGIKNMFSGIKDWFSDTFSNIKDWASDTFSSIGEKIKNSPVGKAVENVVDGAKNVGEKIADGVKSAVEKTKDVAKNVAEGVVSGVKNAGSAVKNAVKKLKFWASGTNNAPKGLAVVGEAGPELVRFRGGEQVLNNHNTNKALENMGGTTINQNVTFNNLQDTTAYAMMNQFKQYNRQMAINGVL